MAIKPFKFKLKKVSSKQQELLQALYQYLPAIGIQEELFSKGISDAVCRHIGKEISFHLEAVHQESFSTFSAKLPQTTVLAVIGMEPLNRKAVCEIDPILAINFVERLLGGKPSSVPKVRGLSDTEQGVLQYLILQVLANIYKMCGKNPRVHFRFDKFASGALALRDLAKPKDGIALLVYRVKVGKHAGFVRLALPDPFIEEAFLGTQATGEIRPGEKKYLLSSISRFSYVRVPLWAEVGRTKLTGPELSQLEEGDIVLLDDSGVALYDGKPSGNVMLRVGDGEIGGFEAELEVDARRAHCKIVGIRK